MSFLRKPLLHFFILGIVLIFLDARFNQEEQVFAVNYPSVESVAELRSQWLRTTRRAPSDAEMQRLVQMQIDEEILFQEALRWDLHLMDSVVQQRLLRDMKFMDVESAATSAAVAGEGPSDQQLLEQAYAMDLHRNDLVVRRRLVQSMESILRAPGERKPPVEADLQSIYTERAEEFTVPEAIRLAHIFVSRDKHGAESEERARRLHKAFQLDKLSLDQAMLSTDPFLSGHQFPLLSERQLQKHFGADFAAAAFGCGTKQWCGPIESPYGQHIVWLSERKEARLRERDEVLDKIQYYYRREQGESTLNAGLETLRDRYTVIGRENDE